MYLNRFSVVIPEGREVDDGYVEMSHGQTYTIRLKNSRSVRCNARVEVDGEHVGTFRIGAHSNITLERPSHDHGQFTFYKAGTQEARQAQLDRVSVHDLGLVSVTFTPEKRAKPLKWRHASNHSYPSDPWYDPSGTARGRSVSCYYTNTLEGNMRGMTKGASAGGTGLSGHSDQQFYQADAMTLDYTQATSINLRLVTRDSGPRPLTHRSNPTPPPVL
jgi:hypothetical protein